MAKKKPLKQKPLIDIQKIKAFMFEPAKAFKKEEKTHLREAFIWVAVLGIPYAVLAGIFSTLLANIVIGDFSFFPANPLFNTLVPMIMAMAMAYAGVLVGPFIGALFVHLGVLMMGGKKGFKQTYKATLFAHTPVLALGWIPVIGTFFSLWTFIMNIIGVRTYHKLTTRKAIIAVILPALLITLIAGFLARSFLVF